MLKNLLILCVGFLALVGALFFFKGVIYVAETRQALDEDVVRPQPLLSDAFAPADGWSEDELQAARDQAGSSGAAAVVVLHRGRLVAEWGLTHEKLPLESGQPSLLSLLWGAGRQAGVLPSDMPRPDLDSSDAQADSLALALTDLTGCTLDDLFRSWLAELAGLGDVSPGDVVRIDDPERTVPHWTISLTTRDLARLGQLILDGGRHADQQVVAADWLITSTSPLRGRSRVRAGYVGDGWHLPASDQIELRADGGSRLHVDRRLQLVVAVGVPRGGDATERAVWTVLGERQDGGEFRSLLRQLKGAGRLGIMDPTFRQLVDAGDVIGAVAHARALRAAHPDTFLFTEAQLNDLGYEVLRDDHAAEAVALFQLNVDEYPGYFNTHDSLAEAYLELGNRDLARQHYERALELNPSSRSSQRALDRMDEDGD